MSERVLGHLLVLYFVLVLFAVGVALHEVDEHNGDLRALAQCLETPATSEHDRLHNMVLCSEHFPGMVTADRMLRQMEKAIQEDDFR